ncbi:hypothetical protein BC938DRAFT_472980 [Jimgerdemannia flammicorona]|uniref:HECT-type E3 ubiquitin transferase n=1 Tax=Jimgerdemannia flammicorona TaxID=994334 RepID=A0A433Q515_9FUNG|nr:hypothetical protein BC938DRAFT_472980 [Jimgerdemannia flammicorona]
MSYLRVLQILLLRLPSTLLANEEDSTIAATNSGGTFSDDDDSSDEDGDAHMIDAPPLRSAPNPANTEPKLDPLLLRWLSLLHDPAHLASLLGYHLNRFPAPPSKSASASPIAKIANYLVTVMIRWSSSKDSLLAHLMYALPVPAGNGKGEVVGSGSVLRVLWETWKATSLGKKVLEVAASKGSGKVPVGVVFDFANAEDWAILVLLCEVFTRLLVTMGDDEFYGQRHGKNPLRLEEIIEMSGVLRDIAFMLHWNDASLKMESVLQGTCIKVTHLRTVVTKLTQHIHARDSRRPFCPTTHWLVSDLDVESFVRSVVEEEQALDHERELDLRFRRRHMSVASPRLAVLNQIPFVIPFEDRVQIFREFVANDRERWVPRGRVLSTVHRDNVLEDGFMQLNKLGPSLKSKIAISFIDKFGLAEEGIDGGGVFKEFLTA